ncbi:Oxysterol-binding protein-domain-containing protein [Lentinula raphanica]|nr:Oxysterol-binding protein-domain-containing protein [Lentinula raphanica]
MGAGNSNISVIVNDDVDRVSTNRGSLTSTMTNPSSSSASSSQAPQAQKPISQSPSSLPSPSAPPPPLKGYLLKYTNLAKGYNTRWFVLRGGVLSYYRRQEDESVASRGAISMRSAGVRVSPSDKLRFEIFSGSPSNPASTPSPSSQSQRWYLKANHPIEANRWISAIEEWKAWARQHQPGQSASASAQEAQHTQVQVGLGKPSMDSTSESLRPSISSTNRFIGGLQSTIRKKTRKATSSVKSSSNTTPGSVSDAESFHRQSGSIHGIQSEAESGISGLSGGRPREGKEKAESRFGYTDVSDGEEDEDGDVDQDDDQKEEFQGEIGEDVEETETTTEFILPYADTYEQQSKSIFHQLESIKHLDVPSFSSLSMLETLISQYISMSNSRETSLQTHLATSHSSLTQTRKTLRSTRKTLASTRYALRESETKRKALEATVKQARRAQKAWEESMKVVLEEEQGLEKELKRTSRNFGSLKSSRRESRRMGTAGSPTRSMMMATGQRSPSSGGFDSTVGRTGRRMTLPRGYEEDDGLKTPTVYDEQFDRVAMIPDVVMNQAGEVEDKYEDADADSEDEDDEDEFFDAIESNNIPNLVVPAQLQLQPSNPSLSLLSTTKPIAPLASSVTSSITSVYFTPTSSQTSSTIAVSSSSSSPSASSLLSSSPVSIPTSTFHTQYAPYAHLRTSLSLSTSRPAASLWSALKNSIGKDLTKISFPVYFNEPTSMLQRMAEDMEFSECLDIASNTPSPHLRIAYIAAFAMSNYSSTIGRIAKPFNPMLGETFEYVYLGEGANEPELDLDIGGSGGRVGKAERVHERGQQGKQGYRYVSEQVSHHPPISACWAESFGMIEAENGEGTLGKGSKILKTGWRYFGEVDAQNKFMGKSFEIRPTGVAHVELRIPKAWTVDDRASEVVEDEDEDGVTDEMITEHYTWKKVTTSVSGFILGSPTIDHYGDMLITNHHTSSQCILTFKPRGWRGKDAYEIAGRVISSTGEPVYDIAGKWDSQLVMRPVHQASSGQVHGPHSQEYILLWRNTLKPAGTPFNLTPFAVTLNDLPSIPVSHELIQDKTKMPEDRALSLRSSLPPTDSRLRPDQRAFEMGFWDLANVLKGNQEEKQRERRRKRERELEGASSDKHHHQPRWFRAETDGDTGERVWMPVREDDSGKVEYWVERERIWRAVREGSLSVVRKGSDRKGEEGKWKNVEAIFIDEPEELRDGRVLDSV